MSNDSDEDNEAAGQGGVDDNGNQGSADPDWEALYNAECKEFGRVEDDLAATIATLQQEEEENVELRMHLRRLRGELRQLRGD